ncbi:MAG TPA: shikimate dehydrogenase [bacterium]
MANPNSVRLGLIGYPVGHSVSPLMHQHLLKALNLSGSYESFETAPDQFEERIRALKASDIRGFNVTIPFKRQILALLDEVDESAQLVGAVNSVFHNNNRLLGFNTDGVGFERALQFHQIDVAKRQAIILGAGGAARAVALALIRGDIRRIYLANRTPGRSLELVEYISRTGFFNFITIPMAQGEIAKLVDTVDFIINATPIGMWPDIEDTPLEFSEMATDLTAIDLIYNPLQTRFLRSAKAAGIKVMDGLDMLIFQGIAAMQIWTGRQVDPETVYGDLRNLLTERLNNYGQS